MMTTLALAQIIGLLSASITLYVRSERKGESR